MSVLDWKDYSKICVPVGINCVMSAGAFVATVKIIPKLKAMFIKANLFGIDMSKRNSDKVPEAVGVVSGCMFLVTMFLFIPVPFGSFFINGNFPHDEFVEFVAALLSICCMILLGFADDVLDLKWRHKLLLPTIASLPLLTVYFVNYNSTTILVPKPLRMYLGLSVDLGTLYYVYMGMLAVFCTNAINIYAGINGLEVGQSLVIALSIAIFNVVELSGIHWKAHQFSLFFMVPYIATSLALLKYNWYPSKVFIGDTFCYFSGMTFAVVAILGHFSKTVLLFFIPQIANFLYSVPQLFHFVPCPRHRLPKFNSKTDKLEASTVCFQQSELSLLGHVSLSVLKTLGLIRLQRQKELVVVNNLTVINFALLVLGPTHEATLTTYLILLQVFCTVLAFLLRYPFAYLIYDT